MVPSSFVGRKSWVLTNVFFLVIIISNRSVSIEIYFIELGTGKKHTSPVWHPQSSTLSDPNIINGKTNIMIIL